MSQLVEFPLDGGGAIRVEIGDEEGVVPVGRAGEVVARAQQTLESALAQLRPVTDAVLRNLRDAAEPPDRVCVEFGVKLAAKGGLVVASGTSEANLKVQLEWNRADPAA
ncbi:hypothetical protein GA0074696_5006 [Micromonospora purpureochromogenes]|uniref:Trypsin-co-occurring domain-containing protein n=1 Tax=Micromonospora purpureochromogenes TaxID=47872 RepID=A0A1C4ZWT3_9ACTN|nr:CU044_2847 family protein [Micromonospora purpureochromogenes]SCF37420.1 hypothetical protein GA0074696_5006 [Micromonospora purpureochromogenes]